MGQLPQLARQAARSRPVRVLFAVFLLSLTAAAATIGWAPLPKRLNARDSVVITYQDGSLAHVFLSSDEKWRIPVHVDNVDADYIRALIRLEDKRFRSHLGIDPVAIARAVWLNVTRGRRVSGASTITMQVVRLLEPRERTYINKLLEALQAIALETRFSKDEILAIYLRFAPFGRNIEGVEAASQTYFGHRASQLSPDEIAALLAVPQAPNKRFPRADHTNALQAARDDIAKRLLDEDALPRGPDNARLGADAVHKMIVESFVPEALRPMPRDMPHVARWAAMRLPNETRIRTTIDRGLQRTVERALARHRSDANASKIHNAAVVVADHRANEVRALVGNFDFSNEPGSQIPAFDIARSPGSLMKPFIFALGIDRGLVLPQTLVQDIPERSGTYTPTNYDGTYQGLVRLDDALARSLNVPFIDLLRSIGLEPFSTALTSMGAKHLRPDPGYYGLTAAIGGIDVTPLEVAEMYTTLANQGRYRPLMWQPETAAPDGWRVFAPGAAWLTQRTMRTNDRPGINRRRVNPNAGNIYWKTGTSFGNRDAWAAGSGEHYTAVVWMGNLDNARSSGLVGASRSGPVLFDVLEAIEFEDALRPQRPDDLVKVEVCAYSGQLPTRACNHTKSVWALQSAVPTARCPYHRMIDVDTSTGLALGPSCADRESTTKRFVVWPASIRRYLSDRARRGLEPPDWAPGCRATIAKRPPSITSPPHGQSLVLMPGIDPSRQEVPLEANTPDGTQKLSWFVDGVFLGAAPAHKRVWWTPSLGEHELVVQDEAGRSTRRQVRVR